MIISFAEELGASRVRKLAETVNDFRCISLELLQCRTAYGESHLECALVLIYEFKQELVHRKIAQVSHSLENGPVREVIIIMRILADIEKPVTSQSGRLMDLEIQA